MKSNLFKTNLSLLLLLVASFSFAQNADELQFEQTTQKFKRVDEGHQITLTYNFNYTGKVHLKMNPPQLDCSCTEVILSKDVINPGSKNSIQVKFNTAAKIGWQERTITLYFTSNKLNAEPIEKKIIFKGAVKASKATKDAYQLNK
jgi:V8-like Glu-specific endopeptidase